MRILITGADGFIGKNLRLALAHRSDVSVSSFTRAHGDEQLKGLIQGSDLIFHLAG
jgi:UDP-2-acetamido-2,6-beta-L-arabino-hexul-4-ose reductase